MNAAFTIHAAPTAPEQNSPAHPDTSIEQFAAAIEVTSQDVPF